MCLYIWCLHTIVFLSPNHFHTDVIPLKLKTYHAIKLVWKKIFTLDKIGLIMDVFSQKKYFSLTVVHTVIAQNSV